MNLPPYINEARAQWRAAVKDAKALRDDYDRLLTNFQTYECKHANTKRHSDPSGNNDSFTECLDCGKEL